jgi:hypothetical protein
LAVAELGIVETFREENGRFRSQGETGGKGNIGKHGTPQ